MLDNADMDLDTARYCPSDNVGVRSFSLESLYGEYVGEFEAKAFAVILREAATALEILRGTFKICDGDNAAKPKSDRSARIKERKKYNCLAEGEKEMYFGEDLGFAPIVPSVQDKLMRDR
jgi:hypothetical protein